MFKLLVPILIMSLFSGCIFVSKEVQYYDEQCHITKRKHVLSTEQMASIGNCSGTACAMVMAGAGIVSAASLVVSGTVVVTQNTLSWLEQSKGCTKSEPKDT
ncbi:hypothetical protein [Pseudoalteromonas luteoviolacea]|uniref:Lipoprotein n=1 Tax=Pseudoalteromonas luteoviolacea S4054 TaxID=1129367 RepID=A0A0F6A7T6_9GAMM|nr:hypothetical protein [Pseudoalteromonas luteoviolacea]AOT07809.1 hypothetical protein S4054249_08130 [Pseudoalteromonas luteoviolacea]AOT12725.1 hypothetical protein S40542_08130 [Pseudoalteromonas luteoviolacea]AOT17638.1 hypothetical protein S4054_08125 [Pseudoalteromonas luteoviolacea]KKE82297.1 hypothetical protein N479_18840 [Pseudoalteromonas luteoviolacea S4054]KZN78949.1 hypothetical protein N481_00470 [Pseudoalteromonas luteoviolacea S4047-1]